MESSIAVALIGLLGSVIVAVISYAGVVKTSKKSSSEMTEQLKISQAVTDQKITDLTREVREHNNFAKRVPVLEEQIKVANHRISDLEEAAKR